MSKKKIPKKPVPPKELSRFPFEVNSIRLIAAGMRQKPDGKSMKLPEVTQTINVKFTQPGETTTRILLNFRVFDPKEQDVAEKSFVITASYGVVFTRKEGVFSLDECERLAKQVALHMAWPYWREFVQSSTCRMLLPPLTMPVINPLQIGFAMQKEKQVPVPKNSKKKPNRIAK